MSIEVAREEYTDGEAITGLRRLDILRAGASVKRYHTWRTIRTQSVGDHTHGVMQILAEITPKKLLTADLLMAAVHHDISELLTGDIPSPAKRAYPELRTVANQATREFEEGMGLRMNITPEQAKFLRWADIMECCQWALEEIAMGNTYCVKVALNALTYMIDGEMPSKEAHLLYMETHDRFERYTNHLKGFYK